MPKIYCETNYAYKCPICDSADMVSVKPDGLTEVYYYDIHDNNDNVHRHDHNNGMMRLHCKNGHNTKSTYIPACECGWNGIEGYANSCATEGDMKPVACLFDSDSD